jgi:hypothetical protein
MITGMTRMIKVIAACFLIGLSSFQCAHAIQLQDLLEKVASTTEKSASFSETKTAYFLKKPVISKGILEFSSPSTLIKRMTHPKSLEQKVEADVLSISRGGEHQRTMSLNSEPELALGINAILWVLSGNFNKLDDSFHITFADNPEEWTIELLPKNPQLAGKIAIIILKGLDANINLINIEYSNGNTVKTVIYGHR